MRIDQPKKVEKSKYWSKTKYIGDNIDKLQ